MDNDSQFHITVVSQRRRSHAASGENGAPHRDADTVTVSQHRSQASRSVPAEQGASGTDSSRRSGRSHHHHHQNYGTLDLGPLPDYSQEKKDHQSTQSLPAEPTKGQLQKEFMSKYAPALDRKYQNKDNSKLFRIVLMIVILVVAGLLFFFLLQNQALGKEGTAETFAAVNKLDP